MYVSLFVSRIRLIALHVSPFWSPMLDLLLYICLPFWSPMLDLLLIYMYLFLVFCNRPFFIYVIHWSNFYPHLILDTFSTIKEAQVEIFVTLPWGPIVISLYLCSELFWLTLLDWLPVRFS